MLFGYVDLLALRHFHALLRLRSNPDECKGGCNYKCGLATAMRPFAKSLWTLVTPSDVVTTERQNAQWNVNQACITKRCVRARKMSPPTMSTRCVWLKRHARSPPFSIHPLLRHRRRRLHRTLLERNDVGGRVWRHATTRAWAARLTLSALVLLSAKLTTDHRRWSFLPRNAMLARHGRQLAIAKVHYSHGPL